MAQVELSSVSKLFGTGLEVVDDDCAGLSCHVTLDWPLTHWFIRISLHFIMNIVAVARLSVAPVRLDHVRPLLRDHDGGGVGVPRHHVRHDGGVDDT